MAFFSWPAGWKSQTILYVVIGFLKWAISSFSFIWVCCLTCLVFVETENPLDSDMTVLLLYGHLINSVNFI